MKSKPVRRYATPKYPTRLEVAARPDLLRRHQPPAWRQWPELTRAVGLFLLADTAQLLAAPGPPKDSHARAETNALAVVAPIFQHGEGRGATGCIVMSPPVFLSEEEALQVIREEMAAKGVQLGTNKVALAGVGNGTAMNQAPFMADVADPKRKVFVEFLAQYDAPQWEWARQEEEHPDGPFTFSTVRSYDMPKTAAYLADRVKRRATERVYFGTFYDPLAGHIDYEKMIAALPRPATGAVSTVGKAKAGAKAVGRSVSGYLDSRTPLEKMESGAKALSRRLLREQVRDFVKWLQAQGAI